MHVVVVGLNHRTAPIELRERLAFRREQLSEAFARLREQVGLEEAAILSTCNRVEIYAGVGAVDGTVPRLFRFLSDHAAIELPQLAERLYSYQEPQSVAHLFAVASGLDSMVLGEGEILHQVKHAYERARESGATGKALNGLFQRALNAAKAVRSQTAIGQGCVSIGTVAVELAEKIFGRLSGTSVLLIGAGKIGELTLRRLADRGVARVRVMNRTFERASALSSVYGAEACLLAELPQRVAEADIVISSTSAPSVLLRREEVASAMRQRHQRPLCVVDLGVPRNIDPSVGGLENVYLFDVDDLQGVVARTHAAREEALTHSRAMIGDKVERFLAWWRQEALAAPCLKG